MGGGGVGKMKRKNMKNNVTETKKARGQGTNTFYS